MKTRYFNKAFLRGIAVVGSLLLVPGVLANDSVKIDLKGYIKKSCGIGNMSGSFDLSKENSQEIGFELYCNTPFDITMSSRNGGLKNGSNLIRYNVSLIIPELGVQMYGDSKQINKRKLFRSVNKIPFESQGQLKIHLVDQLYYAGNYRENLVIEIFPNLVM